LCVSPKDAMRRHPEFLYLTALALLCVPPCYSQDASKIIDQYVKAAGGAKTLSRIQTLSVDGTFQAAGSENPGTYTIRVKLPNRYYTEVRTEGITLIEAYNGKSGWHRTESGELATFLGPEALEVEAAAQYYNVHLREQVMTDMHARKRFRVATVRNLDEWYAAFGVQPGETLYLAPPDRVQIW